MLNYKILFFLFILFNCHSLGAVENCSYNIYQKKYYSKKTILFRQILFFNKPDYTQKRRRGQEQPTSLQGLSFFDFSYFYKNITIGLSLLKKPGEKINKINLKKTIFFFNSNNEYFSIKNFWKIKIFIVGDFTVGFGQGLVFNNSFGFGKPVEQIKIIKIQRGLAYTKSHNANKIKGISSSFIITQNLTLTLFCGLNFIDGTIRGRNVYSVCRRTVYNTQKNLLKKNVIKEKVCGGNISFQTNDDRCEMGVNYVNTLFNIPFQQNMRENYSFSGRGNVNYSIYGRFLFGPILLFGEYGFSHAKETLFSQKNGNGKAYIVGFITNTFKFLDCAFMMYDYAPNYYNFYGGSISHQRKGNCQNLHGAGTNEAGIYLCLLFFLHYNFQITYSVDIYKNHFPKNKNKKKTKVEHILFAKYTFWRNRVVYLSFRGRKNLERPLFRNMKNYLKGCFTYTFENNLSVYFQLHFSFLKIKKTSYGFYSCVNIPFYYEHKFSLFLALAEINDENNLYFKTKKTYREFAGCTLVNVSSLIAGAILALKINRKYVINILFQFQYPAQKKEAKKKKKKTRPILTITLSQLK